MTRSLTRSEIADIQAQLRGAHSIAEVLYLARSRRIERVPGGYRITSRVYHADTCEHDECVGTCRDVEYTADDLAWFRAPIRGAL